MSRAGRGYSVSIDLVTLVDNRVFPGEWDCPGTVYREGLEQSTGQDTLSDCCVIGECGLDYTEPAHSLPVTAVSLFHRHIALANQLGKPLVLHLRGNHYHPILGKSPYQYLRTHTTVIGFMYTVIVAVFMTTSTGLGYSPIVCLVRCWQQGLVSWHDG